MSLIGQLHDSLLIICNAWPVLLLLINTCSYVIADCYRKICVYWLIDWLIVHENNNNADVWAKLRLLTWMQDNCIYIESASLLQLYVWMAESASQYECMYFYAWIAGWMRLHLNCVLNAFEMQFRVLILVSGLIGRPLAFNSIFSSN